MRGLDLWGVEFCVQGRRGPFGPRNDKKLQVPAAAPAARGLVCTCYI